MFVFTQRWTLAGRLLLLAGLLLAAAVPVASGAEITLNATADTYLDEGGATGRGSQDYMYAGNWQNKRERALVRFDMAQMPAYQQIDSITLSLTVYGVSGSNDAGLINTVGAYEVSQANKTWDEGSTWTGETGLTQPASDYADSLLGEHTFTNSHPSAGVPVTITFSGDTTALTAILDRWTQQGNAGLLLIDNRETAVLPVNGRDRVAYYTRDFAGTITVGGEQVDPRPRLIVNYSVPEPTTGVLVLVGLGGLLMLPRRGRTPHRG